MIEKGHFVTFEGPEGSGKSTQAENLTSFLEEKGVEVISPREPGGTPAGEAIRKVLQHDSVGDDLSSEAEALLFAASRAILVRDVIVPALDAGKWVVCDRFADSTVAYQGYGRGCDVEQMLDLNAFATCSVMPDLTILMDLDVDEGFRRIEGRTALDRMERESREFHQKVRAGYLQLAERFDDRFVVLNAALPLDEVELAVRGLVCDRLGIDS